VKRILNAIAERKIISVVVALAVLAVVVIAVAVSGSSSTVAGCTNYMVNNPNVNLQTVDSSPACSGLTDNQRYQAWSNAMQDLGIGGY
jgi:hypothetical protein